MTIKLLYLQNVLLLLIMQDFATIFRRHLSAKRKKKTKIFALQSFIFDSITSAIAFVVSRAESL